MYRCTECDAEYEIKPQYCDCGNDTFEEINVDEVIVEKQVKNINDNQVEALENFDKTSIDKTVNNFNKNIDKSFIISCIFSLLCVLLGLYILIFVGNGIYNTIENIDNKLVNTDFDKIPTINKIWNDEPVKEYNGNGNINVNQPAKTILSDNVVDKTSDTGKKVLPLDKKESIKSSSNNVNNSNKNLVSAKPSVKKTVKQQSTNGSKNINKYTQNQENQEILAYKVKLRNFIAKKINFANVVGDGSCVFTFKVNNQGALTEKKFVSTTNVTLSDEVYEAILNVTTFSPPPVGYKPVMMKFNVKMYNNSFEISLN